MHRPFRTREKMTFHSQVQQIHMQGGRAGKSWLRQGHEGATQQQSRCMLMQSLGVPCASYRGRHGPTSHVRTLYSKFGYVPKTLDTTIAQSCRTPGSGREMGPLLGTLGPGLNTSRTVRTKLPLQIRDVESEPGSNVGTKLSLAQVCPPLFPQGQWQIHREASSEISSGLRRSEIEF
jgi:hypothetical protein